MSGVAGEGRRQERRQGRGAKQRACVGSQGGGTVVPVRLWEVGVQEGRVTLHCGGLTGKGLRHAGGAGVVCKFSVVEVGVR